MKEPKLQSIGEHAMLMFGEKESREFGMEPCEPLTEAPIEKPKSEVSAIAENSRETKILQKNNKEATAHSIDLDKHLQDENSKLQKNLSQ